MKKVRVDSYIRDMRKALDRLSTYNPESEMQLVELEKELSFINSASKRLLKDVNDETKVILNWEE